MKFFGNNNNSIIVLIFSIAILMLCLCVNVSLATQTHPPTFFFGSNNMSSSSYSSSSQAFSHSKQGPNSAHDHQPATVAASLRKDSTKQTKSYSEHVKAWGKSLDLE